jgi:hypothetical protein
MLHSVVDALEWRAIDRSYTTTGLVTTTSNICRRLQCSHDLP